MRAAPWQHHVPCDLTAKYRALWGWTAISGWAVVAVLGLVLLVRRSQGAAYRPLPGASLAAAACGLAMFALLLRHYWSRSSTGPLGNRWMLGYFAPLAAIGLWAIALTPTASWTGQLTFWIIIFGEEVYSANLMKSSGRWRSAGQISTVHLGGRQPAPESPRDRLDPRTVQQFTRWRHADGREHISGRARVDFGPGTRTATLHLAFCPPFDQTPEVHFEQSCGPDASIVLGRAMAHGARLEVQLSQPADKPESVWVELFVASAEAVEN
jgi:hypothetical protein